MKRLFTAAICASIAVSGCAQKSENITAAYVSPVAYQGFTCRQIREEATRVNARAAQAMGLQDKAATNDAVATGVALVLFWPAAFFISGNRENGAEVARLKGELEALEQANIRKNCGIEFRKAPPSKKAKAAQEEEA